MTEHTTPSGLTYHVGPALPLTYEMRKALWETATYLATEAQRNEEQRAYLDSLTPDEYMDHLTAQEEELAARYDAQRRSA